MTWKPSYATATQVREYIRIPDLNDDVEIEWAISAASRAVDLACNRQFGVDDAPTQRYYSTRWDRRRLRWVIEIDDLMTTSGMSVAFDSQRDQTYISAITDYRLFPLNAAPQGRPWTEIVLNLTSPVVLSPFWPTDYRREEGDVRVTGTFGWTTVSIPDPIVQATVMQASRFLQRRDAPFGVAGSPEQGGQMRLLAKVDPDVDVTLSSYRRWWGAA